ncbi:MFS transporter [Streptomyces boninensis]|uniref:MFS transporter n=1 Tax=Streptomyces boninensis TaxID=2039455 RepID=UPI003B21D7A7
MRTYRELAHVPEFRPLFGNAAAHVAGMTVSGLALGTLVYDRTRSPLLSALSMFGPSLAQMLGATMLLSAADRLPPRATTTGIELVYAAGTAALAIPGMPLGGMFAVIVVLGVVGSVGGGVRYGLLTEVLPKEGYLLGRSVLNMSAGTMQICGYGAGGVLVLALGERGTLLAGAGLYLLAAAASRFGLTRRPPRASGRPSVAATWRTNRLLWSSRPRRYVYLALWVPNGLVVGCESLFVSYEPRHAGVLFAAAAAGMLTGDIIGGRFVPKGRRTRLGVPMLILLAAPYLIFALQPPLYLAAAIAGVSSVGFCASLMQQERLMNLTPEELSGHAFGLHASGMLTMQAVGAGLAGVIAERTSPGTAMAVMAAASLAVTASLARGLSLSSSPRIAPGTVMSDSR